MKREEAIELLEDLYGEIEDNHGRDYDEAFRMAIEALSAEAIQLKQTDTLIIATALQYLIEDEERHELDRATAKKLKKQILKLGASMCADAAQINGSLINKQNTINAIENTDVKLTKKDWDELMDAINALPSTEAVQAVQDCRNCKHGKYNDHWNTWFCYNNCECSNWDLWESAEVIQHGEWVLSHIGTIAEGFYCSRCGKHGYQTDFCPSCGADMRGGDVDNDE